MKPDDTSETILRVARAICRSLNNGREPEDAFLLGAATGGLAYLEAAQAAIDALQQAKGVVGNVT